MDLLWSATYHSQVSDSRARGRGCEYSNILILYCRIFSGESITGKFISQLSREPFPPTAHTYGAPETIIQYKLYQKAI